MEGCTSTKTLHRPFSILSKPIRLLSLEHVIVSGAYLHLRQYGQYRIFYCSLSALLHKEDGSFTVAAQTRASLLPKGQQEVNLLHYQNSNKLTNSPFKNSKSQLHCQKQRFKCKKGGLTRTARTALTPPGRPSLAPPGSAAPAAGSAA
jgi:hypothetical protein